jgi:hypothetical protein
MQSFDIYVDDMNNPLVNDIKFIDTSFNRLRIGSGTPHTGSGYWDGIVIRNCSDQQKAIATCSPGDIIFQDDFEYADSITNHDWISVSAAGVAQTQTDIVAVGSSGLKLNDVSSSAPNTYIHSLPILNGNFQIDYYVRTEQYGQTVLLALLGDQGVIDGQLKGIRTELSDNINRGFFAQNTPYFVYQLNKWYHIRLVVRTQSQSFDIYVDDMDKPLATNLKFLDRLFNTILIQTATAGVGPGYWDDIVVRCLP